MNSQFTKGPWTISQYGATATWDEKERRNKYTYDGKRYTINEIGVDLHVQYAADGLGDNFVMNAQDVREVVALVRAAPELRDALFDLLMAFEWRNNAQEMAQALHRAREVYHKSITPVGEQEGTP